MAVRLEADWPSNLAAGADLNLVLITNANDWRTKRLAQTQGSAAITDKMVKLPLVETPLGVYPPELLIDALMCGFLQDVWSKVASKLVLFGQTRFSDRNKSVNMKFSSFLFVNICN